MRPPFIKIIRRSLIGVIFLVLLAVLLNYMQIWRSRNGAAKETPKILSSEMIRSAEGLAYSDYNGEILRFKIHALKLLETRAGKNHLEGIVAYAFDSDGSIRNEIRSQNAVYDQDHNVADFLGNVRLFLGRDIELRTDSLHYDLSTNIGTTRDPLKLHSPEANGTARGVRFDQKNGALELGSDVDFILIQQQTTLGADGKPVALHATSERAYCSEIAHRILFRGKARIEAGSGTLFGDSIEVLLSPDQKHVTSLNAAGNAEYQSEDGGEKRTLSGGRMVFGIDASGVLEKIDVSERALFSSVSASRELELQGSEIDLTFDTANGALQGIQSRSGVRFRMNNGLKQTLISGDQLTATFRPQTKNFESLEVRKRASFSVNDASETAGNELHADEIRMSFREWDGRAVVENLRAKGSAQWRSTSLKSDTASPRDATSWSLGASLLEMFYSGSGDFLESGSASGSVVISANSKNPVAHDEVRRLNCDYARFYFFPQNNLLREMEAEGHVRTVYEGGPSSAGHALAETFHTASNRLKADFELKDGTQVVKSVTQWDNFRYEDPTRNATAGRSDYDAETGLLVLRESPAISDETGTTSGEQMEYDRKAGVLSVRGKVRSTLAAHKGERSPFATSASSEPMLITAGEMKYWTGSGRTRYEEKVQLLSETQQLQAHVLELFDSGERMEARGEVLHLISDDRRPGTVSSPTVSKEVGMAAGEPMTIRSLNLEYLRESNALHYSGNVRLKSGDIYLSSEDLNAVLDKEEKSVERATARGKVFIRQGDRECKGETADWFLNPGKFVVVGDPAEAYEPGRGRSFARRLTSFTADDRILLEGR